MKFLPISLLLVVCLLAGKGYSDTIQCYVCDDCGVLSDSQLQSCPAEVLPTTPSETTVPPTTTSSTIEQTSTGSATSESTEQTLESSSETISSTIESTEQTPISSTSIPTEQPTNLGRENKKLPNAIQVFSNRRSYRSILRAGPTYHCYSLDRVDGDSQKANKGCVEVPEDSTPCDVLKAEYGESIQNCKSCQSDECNSSAALKFSLVTFVIAIVIGVLCK